MNSVRTVLLASLAVAATATIAPAGAQQPQPVGPYKDFKGTINLDVRDSKADWGPFTPKKAPAGAPNILFVLYDDTGLAAWSPYGGRINMPTLDKLAENGITYTQWHTVALCSPTRSTLLTGRNHTLNGMAAITEGSNGFPGWSYPAASRHHCASSPG
jgi:sulfatase-like protein